MKTLDKPTAKQLTLDLSFLGGMYKVTHDKVNDGYELRSTDQIITEVVIRILVDNYHLTLKHIMIDSHGELVARFK